MVEPLFVKASTSWPERKLPVMAIVAEASVVALPSVTVMPASIATGVDAVLSPATKAALPPSVVIVGGAVTFSILVVAALDLVPSLVAKLIVRLPAVVDVLEKVTARIALAHCASVAVFPAEVAVSTPVAALYEATILPMVEPSFVNPSTSPE
jgi:hypothetical protein